MQSWSGGGLFAAPALSAVLVLLACGAAGPTDPAPQPQSATQPPAGEPEHASSLRRAIELEAAGRFVEAQVEVERAIAAGAGRDAKLLAAKLAIQREDLDAATTLLEPLAAADPNDADAQYNLALVAQRRGSFNKARAGYLAALRADPNYAAARYNLAVMTWNAGAREEAQHHARKFLELRPDDPRAAELRHKVELDATPTPAG